MIPTTKRAEQVFLWNLPPFCSSGNSNSCMTTMTCSLTLCRTEWRCHGKHGSEGPNFHIPPAWFMSCIPDQLWAAHCAPCMNTGTSSLHPASSHMGDTANKGPARRAQAHTAPTVCQRYHRAPKSWVSLQTPAAQLPLSQSSLLAAHSWV